MRLLIRILCQSQIGVRGEQAGAIPTFLHQTITHRLNHYQAGVSTEPMRGLQRVSATNQSPPLSK